METAQKFGTLLASLSASLVDREEEISCMVVGLAAGEHVLLVGPPGTGKSLLCDGVTGAISGATSFQRLLGKYSEPTELFGPVSIKGLKDDRLEHVIDGYLPTANVAFVDEIGKASPAIINSLLTVMNERKFDNGRDRVDCPLLVLVAASNEWPVGEGYETCAAMFDRFMLRKSVSYVSPTSLESLIWGHQSPVEACLSLDDVREAQAAVRGVTWSTDGRDGLLEILDTLRAEGIRPSDRRCRKSTRIAQAVAWMHGAASVRRQHLEVLQHVLWEDPTEHPQKVSEVVIGVANPGAQKLAQLLAEAHELVGVINPRNVTDSTYSDMAKLKEVVGKIRHLPGERAQAAGSKLGSTLQRLTADLMS